MEFLKFLILIILLNANNLSLAAEQKLLVIGITQEWDIIHPYGLATFPAQLILQAVMKPLVYFDKDTKLQAELINKVPTFENGLAEKTKDGKLTLNITIKDQAQWGDGVPLTCADLDYGHQVAVSPNTSTLDQEYFNRLEKIEWQPEMPKNCKLTIKKMTFQYNDLSGYFPLPKHLNQESFQKYSNTPNAYSQNTPFIKNPTNPGLFYGPYVIEEYKLGSHITLKRNPNFYGTKPSIEKLIFRYIPSDTTLETYLLSGEIQMAPPNLGLSFDQALRLEKKFKTEKKPFKLLYEKDQIWERLYLNTKNPVMLDRKIRQALNIAFDREELNQAFFEGKMEVAYNMLPSFDPNYVNDGKYKKMARFDLKKAENLLDEAGWKKDTDGIRKKDGKKLSIVMSTTAGNKVREMIQIYIAKKWKKLGIETKIKNYPARTLIGEIIRHNKQDGALLLANSTGLGEAGQSALHSSGIPSKENGFSGLNTSNYASKTMDRLQEQLQDELDLKKRKALVLKIQDVFANDVPMIPLYFKVKNMVVPINLAGELQTGPLGFGLEKVETWEWK